MQVVHLADLHVGAKPYGVEEIRELVFEAFDRAIDYVLEARPDALLVAGDLFHRPRPEHETVIHVLRRMREVVDHGIRVVAAHGEHDTPGHRDQTLLELLSEALPGFYAPRPRDSPVEEWPHRSLVRVAGGSVLVYPFVKTSPDRQRRLAEGLLPRYRALAGSLPGPRVFLAHMGVDPALPGEASVAGVPDLPPVEYAALGHHHARWIARPDEGPKLAVYPGSLFPLTIREAYNTHPRGPLLVDLSGDEPVIQEEARVEVARVVVTGEVLVPEASRARRLLLQAVSGAVGARGGRVIVHVRVRAAPGVPRGSIERAAAHAAKTLGVIVIPHVERATAGTEAGGRGLELVGALDPVEVIARKYRVSRETARLVLDLKDALVRGDHEEARRIIDELASRGELARRVLGRRL